MKCPHCLIEYHDDPKPTFICQDSEGHWYVIARNCPSCSRANLNLLRQRTYSPRIPINSTDQILVWPKGANRPPAPVEVPEAFASDYREACLVMPDSPKASAALSRRCLQHILREKAGVTRSALANEIQEVVSDGSLPSDIAESIDYIRTIGNFAAHPIKSQASGEIVPVEPGESEWCLDVIEMLFDFYFVRPEVIKGKRESIEIKISGSN